MRKLTVTLLVVILTLALGVNALAAHRTVTGNVSFDGKKLNTDYTNADFITAALSLQPGDDLVYTITLKNSYSVATDWWMWNNVIRGFEESKAAARGGAYTYRLSYTAPNGAVTSIYDSETVGGGLVEEDREDLGLSNATSSLKDYFVLGNIKPGETATVTLYVGLDGETQGNDYQTTIADLNMRFAVELTPTNNPEIVKTGDETQIMPYVIATAVSGAALLTIALVRMGKSRKSRRKGRAA